MSVLTNYVQTSDLSNLYAKGIHFVKKYVSADKLDVIEEAAVATIPAIFGYYIASYFIANAALQAAIGVGCGFLSLYSHDRYLKTPFIDREIDEIVLRSKEKPASAPTALFIHTTKDHNGAFSSLHAAAASYEHCARTHAIDRIRGFTMEERQKAGRDYDTTVVMAHGSQHQVNMDGDYFGLNPYRHKYLRFLRLRTKDGGKIILDSCSTAKGENNVAKAVSREAKDTTVYASSALVSSLVGWEYSDDMVPTFNNGWFFKGKDTTRIYQAGKLIYPAQA